MNNGTRIQLERAIVTALVRQMMKIGWNPTCVYDGGEYVKTETQYKTVETVFTVDESTISFTKNGRTLGVLIVLGNGEDIITDYHCPDDCPDFTDCVERVSGAINERGGNNLFLRVKPPAKAAA